MQLSQDYIYKAKTGDSLTAIAAQLQSLDFSVLKTSLKTDNERKAFWINIYNGYTQAALKAAPEKYEDRSAFFQSKNDQRSGRNF